MTTTIIVEFNVIGNYFETERLSQNLQITPTESYEKGEVNSNSSLNLTHGETVWNLSEKETGYYAEVPIKKIINRLKEHQDFLRSFKQNNDVSYLLRVICNIENEQVPVIEFSTLTIDFINQIGGEIDICTYLSFDEGYLESVYFDDLQDK